MRSNQRLESPFRQWLRTILLLLLMALLISGVGGFIVTSIIATLGPSDFSRSLESTELPLGDLKEIAVAPDGAIYTFSAAYCRLQRYEQQPAGPARFVAGWQVPPIKGRPEIRIDAAQVLHMLARGKHWRLEPAYGLVEDPSPFEAVAQLGAPDAGLYEIRWPILLAKVVKLPNEQVLIESRWHSYGLMAGPLIAWLCALAAGLLLLLLDRLLPYPRKSSSEPARE